MACSLLSGCVATQRDILEVENQTDQLKHQIIDLKKTIESLQANQADLAVNVKQLHTDLNAYNETIKQSQGDMAALSSKLDDLQVSLSNKMTSIGETLETAQAKSLADQKAALSRVTPTELFHNAEVRLAKKNYDLAAKGFEEYIAKFPKGALIDVANYNLGEAYFGLKQWEAAGRQYAVVLERYPKSDFTASSRLMYSLCLLNLKKNAAEAKQYLESIISDFPKSPEAKAAAKYLQKLQAEPTKKNEKQAE